MSGYFPSPSLCPTSSPCLSYLFFTFCLPLCLRLSLPLLLSVCPLSLFLRFYSRSLPLPLPLSPNRLRQVLATPAVRRLSRELSIDISLAPISGTGAGGRVLKSDVLAYAATIQGTAEAVTGNIVAVNGNAETAKQRRDDLFPSDNGNRISSSGSAGSSGQFAPPPLALPSVVGRGDEPVGASVAATDLEDTVPRVDGEREARKAAKRERRESVSVPIKGERRTNDRTGDGGGNNPVTAPPPFWLKRLGDHSGVIFCSSKRGNDGEVEGRGGGLVRA